MLRKAVEHGQGEESQGSPGSPGRQWSGGSVQVDVAADRGANGDLALVEDDGLAVGAVPVGGLAGVLAVLLLGDGQHLGDKVQVRDRDQRLNRAGLELWNSTALG